MNQYNFKFNLIIIGICFLTTANAQQIPHENKMDKNCGITPPVSIQLTDMDDLRKVGSCFNLPPKIKTNEFTFLINHQDVCSCLVTDARDKELYTKHSKIAKLNVDKLPKVPSEQDLSSVKSYLETASDNQLKSYKMSPDEEGTILDTIPSGPINDKPGKDGKIDPLEQCFSFNDYLRSRRAPDAMFSGLLSKTSTSKFYQDDWSYDTLKNDFANMQKEIYFLETYDPKNPAWKNRILGASAIQQRTSELYKMSAEKKSALAFLYKNPLIKNFLDSKSPDSEKLKLLNLMGSQYSKKKNVCIISTHPDCINGEADRASQMIFEAEVKKLISSQENEKLLNDAKSLTRVEDSSLLNTPKIELTEKNIISLTQKETGVDPNKCFLYQGQVQSVAQIQMCLKAYAYHCKLVSEFSKRVDLEKSYVVEDLELEWANELNTDYKNNATFKAQTKALCYDDTRFSEALRQQSFSFFRATLTKCRTQSDSAKCQDSHDTYKDYVRLFKEKTKPFEQAMLNNSQTQTINDLPIFLSDNFRPKVFVSDVNNQESKAEKAEPSFDPRPEAAEAATQKSKDPVTPVIAPVVAPVGKDAKPQRVVDQSPVNAAMPTPVSSSEVKNDFFNSTSIASSGQTEAVIDNSTPANENPTLRETHANDTKPTVSKSSNVVEKVEPKISAKSDTSKDKSNVALTEELAELRKQVSDLKTAQPMNAGPIPAQPSSVSKSTLSNGSSFDRQTNAQPLMQNRNQVSPTVSSNFNSNAKEETKIDERVEAIKNKIPVTDRVQRGESDNFMISKKSMSLSDAQAMGNLTLENNPQGKSQNSRQESIQIKDKDFHVEFDVDNSDDFTKLKENDQTTLEKYLKRSDSIKNSVIVLTDKNGVSLYFSVVKGSTSTVAIPLVLTPQQQVDFARRGFVNRKQRLETLNLLLNPAGTTPVKS